MSTPESFGVRAERPTGRNLFQGLFDDAAVFPPGLAPLRQAVMDHVARQSSSYADLVGPLLLPASAIEELLTLDHASLEVGLEVVLVCRPGTSPALLGEALHRLAGFPAVTVTGVEIGWSSGWQQTERWQQTESWQQTEISGAKNRGAGRSVEVPRGAGLQDALSDIEAHSDDANPVQAKFRTGSTPGLPAPTSTELAIFIRASVDHDLSFKLTGGLHHAISLITSAGQDRLGFLNVIAATRWALAHGAEVPEMESLLSQRDPVPILDIITRMSEADASVVRAFFTSYGCCGVRDPIGDLVVLGLIEETKV
jgi:hypothetical protein